MQPRLDVEKVAPDVYKAMFALEACIHKSGLEASLVELIKTRASQINNCAFCMDMHTKQARKHGETQQRLYTLSAWRETPFFTGRERAALAWTEALTSVAETQVPDDVYEAARKHFTEKELVDVSLVIVTINGWNRLSVAFRKVPGDYQPTWL